MVKTYTVRAQRTDWDKYRSCTYTSLSSAETMMTRLIEKGWEVVELHESEEKA